MTALSRIIQRSLEDSVFQNGVLNPLPAELKNNSRLREYGEKSRIGWAVDDFGYQIYSALLPDGSLVIYPALEIIGEVRARKRFPGFEPQFTRDQVKNIAADFVKTQLDNELEVSKRIGMLVHDLRALSTAIYHSAEAAKRLMNEGEFQEAFKRVESVVASQAMLKMRTDAIDFEGNRLAFSNREQISVFRKVDKVSRCFKAKATDQNKQLHFGGSSFYDTLGPDILELVPYALIDNAIKYAPARTVINVTVFDGERIHVVVTSFGPQLKKEEYKTIFQKGARGLAAIETGLPGSGIGLAMAKRIVDLFAGSIFVQQSSKATNIEGIDYFETTFSATFPKC